MEPRRHRQTDGRTSKCDRGDPRPHAHRRAHEGLRNAIHRTHGHGRRVCGGGAVFWKRKGTGPPERKSGGVKGEGGKGKAGRCSGEGRCWGGDAAVAAVEEGDGEGDIHRAGPSLHGPGGGGGGEGDGGRYGRTSGREARTPPSNGEAERPKRALQVARRQAPKVREGEWGKGWGARGRVDGRRTNRRGLVQWGRGGWRACNPEKGRRRRRDFPNPGLEAVGVEILGLEAGAGSQSGIAKGIVFLTPDAMPTLLATLPPSFQASSNARSCAPATVRYTCVQKGAGAMCAQQRARRTGAFSIDRRPTRLFARPVPARRARPGPRSPSRAAISPSSEGLSGPHHADKTNFCGGSSFRGALA